MRDLVLAPNTVQQLRLSINQILPLEVVAFADQINDCEEPSAYPKEEEHLSNAVLKRRNEFIAGRRCARAALAKIGISPCALAPDRDRVPLWPAGTIGSITHSNGLCCAVAGSSATMTGLGVDLETTTRISSGVIERIVHSLEAYFVGADQARGSLIFSAKEAFFQAQSPIWNVWPNFG